MIKNIASILLLTAVFAVIICGAFYGLYTFGLVNLPKVITDYISPTQQTSELVPGYNDEVLSALKNPDELFEGVSVEQNITAESAFEILGELTVQNPISYTCTVSLVGADKELITQSFINIDGDTSIAKTYVDGKMTNTHTDDGLYISSHNASTGKISRIGHSTVHNIYTSCGIPMIAAISAGISEKPHEISIARTDGENILYVEFNIPLLNQRECYFISLDYGILVRAESYENGVLIYSLVISNISLG